MAKRYLALPYTKAEVPKILKKFGKRDLYARKITKGRSKGRFYIFKKD